MIISKHHVWLMLGRSRIGVAILGAYLRLIGKDATVTDRATQIVVDGYPRSANTLAVAAIRVTSRRPLVMAHHVHSPYQFIRAIRLGTPAILLIREPRPAIASLAVREVGVNLVTAFRDYCKFYTMLRGIEDSYFVATFDDVLERLDSVMTCVNVQFGCEFSVPPARVQEIEEVIEYVDQMDMADKGRNTPSARSVSRPSVERKALSDQCLRRIENDVPIQLIEQAEALYGEFRTVSEKQRRILLGTKLPALRA